MIVNTIADSLKDLVAKIKIANGSTVSTTPDPYNPMAGEIDNLTKVIADKGFGPGSTAIQLKFVDALPAASAAAERTIYCVVDASGTEGNLYKEYVIVIGDDDTPKWELLGNATIDLSGYYTKSEVDTALGGYYTKSAVDTTLGGYYTKAAVDTTLGGYYTKSEVNTKVSEATVSDTHIQEVIGTYLSTNYGTENDTI